MAERRRKTKSCRADGRGGWVRGKRRNADVGDWARVRIDLVALINEHFRLGVISAAALANELGVSDRSVRRWMAGEDRPAPETQEAIRTWVAERRATIAARKKQ